MAKRELTEINAGSMADIAFLLLIFFLVTTTMDTNKGLMRKLPPPPEKEKVISEVRERNVFVVLINRNNQLMVRNRLSRVDQVCEKAKEFFLNPNDADNLPEKEEKEIPFFGTVRVSKGVISLQNDRGTSYEKYIEVQNELVRAVNELRDEKAKSKWGKPYADLDDNEKQNAIRKIFPLAISEAEPRAVGGK